MKNTILDLTKPYIKGGDIKKTKLSNGGCEIIEDLIKRTIEINSLDIKIRLDFLNNKRIFNLKNKEIEIKCPNNLLKNEQELIKQIKDKQIRPWNPEEIEILNIIADKRYDIPREYIALLLGRTKRSVDTKARASGIYLKKSKYN